jgi:4-hydroxythreonine-4-phosphate dehydrogenase
LNTAFGTGPFQELQLVTTPIRDLLTGDTRSTLWMLTGAVGLVVLVAVINVAAILLAQLAARRREIAVRAALGAARGRLLRQLFIEALTLYVPAGIGALAVAWGSLRWLQSAIPALLPGAPLALIATPEEAASAFPDRLPVLPLTLAAPATPGRLDPANAPAVIASIEQAVAFAKAGRAGGVVTNPIQKSVLTAAGFPHPGHTEFLGELASAGHAPVMMLACPGLRVVPVTVHVALRQAVAALTTAAIIDRGRLVAEALQRDFGIAAPRLVVAGLNPHAGEDGTMGREDIEIVAPAVAALRAQGIAVRGPLPADTMFTPPSMSSVFTGISAWS